MTFKLCMHKAIKLYQDNFEHDDKWEVELKSKKK